MPGPHPHISSLGLVSILAFIACNQPPAGHSVSIEPGEPTSVDDLVVVFDQVAVDPNEDPLTYSFAWYRDGALLTELTTDTVPSDRTRKGETWSVEVSVDDGRETSLESASAGVTVVNTAPTAVLNIVDDRVGTEDDIVAEVDTADLDEDPVTLDITWTRDGSPTSHSALRLPSSVTSKGEIWEISVTPNDGETDGETQTLAARVANTPPVALGANLVPTELTEATEVRCVSQGWSDPDGDPADYAVRWIVNDVDVGAPSDILTGEYFDKGDTVSCVLTPWDGDDDGEPVSSQTVTVLNSLPEIRSARMDPAMPTTVDDVLALVEESYDADGDTVQVDIAWTVDGRLLSTLPTLSASQTARGQQIQATLTPSDDEGKGRSVVLGPIDIANTAPVLTSVRLTPTTVRTRDVLTASATASDIDDDRVSYTYAWTVNGSPVTHTGMTLDGTTWFDKDDVVQVAVTPTDGTDAGSPMTSASVTVLNTAPTAPTITISPSSPGPTDALRCIVSRAGTDADGDTLRYSATWTRNGSAVSGSTSAFPGDTIPSSSTSAGQRWGCRVSASDGSASASAVSSSVTVTSSWTGKRTFTTCGGSGQNGPTSTQCSTAYSRTPLAGEVTVSGGKQRWTVPTTGTYTIEAWGAQGASAQSGMVGGRGARMRGNFSLTKGTVLNLVVGQAGSSDGCSGGGGGGSYVARGTSPLLIAGGGGGTRSVVSQNGCDAKTSTTAGTGSGSGSTWGCGSKSTSTIGAGGIVSSSSWGSGGGAWNSNGGYEYTSDNGGRSFNGGSRGGGTTSYTAYGGFGGGGAGNGGCGGGGGGGYSGGDGGRLAGGAGSYNSGTSISNSSGARSGQGQITIDLN